MADNELIEPLLDEHERFNPLWLKIKDHLEKGLVKLRNRNDNDIHDERKTAYLRGQIAATKNLLALDKPRPKTEVDDRD